MKKQTFYRLTYEHAWASGWIPTEKNSPSKDVHEMRLKDYHYKAGLGYARNGRTQLIEETILDEWKEPEKPVDKKLQEIEKNIGGTFK